MIDSKAIRTGYRAQLEGLRTGDSVSLKDHINFSQIDFSHCAECGKTISHDECFGKTDGPIFWVSGYVCDACGHTAGNTKKYKYWKHSVTRFNWKTIAVPVVGR